MTGGADSVAGHVYQHDYAAFRILGSEAKRLLLPHDTDDCITSFKIEGRETPEGPAWDVSWKLDNGLVHFRECKDTRITKPDRKAFYHRIRREIACGLSPDLIRIGWVTDPTKQHGHILDHFDGALKLAATSALINGNSLPPQVNSPQEAAEEALYFLANDQEIQAAPLSVEMARVVLRRLTIDRFTATELSEALTSLAPHLFSSGVGSTIRTHIHGTLATTIQEHGSAQYTVRDFIDSLITTRLTIDMVDQLQAILSDYSAAQTTLKVPSIKWACRPDREPKVWLIKERLPQYLENQSWVLVAGTGIGKTTSSVQLFADFASRMNKHHVLRLEAGQVDCDVIKALPRLAGMLAGVARTCVLIDGLDQISSPDVVVWRHTLSQLLTTPNVSVVITARKGVIAAYDWMQEMLSTLPEVALDELTDAQIAAEFADVGLPLPNGHSMRSCLRNAYLLNLYAKTIDPEVAPAAEVGEATAFHIIAAYWRRRVTADSQGIRAADPNGSSGVAKRAAVGYLAERTLAGDVTIRCPADMMLANGIETLRREDVLVSVSTNAVAWSHAWLREYAVIDHLIGQSGSNTATTLAQAVCSVSNDDASRTAAVGGCKLIVAQSALGRIEEYLEVLFAKSKGLAREALTILLDDSPNVLRMDRLSTSILTEALTIARDLRATQWKDQVASLPDSVYDGPEGPELHLAVFRYETEVRDDV
jgi:hypothetical protein